MTVRFHPLANQELTWAGQFYEGRAAGSTTVRSLPVPQFPYAVVYRVESDRLFVVAVAHFRRRPKYWTGRVR